MNVKRFVARTSRDALGLVRDALGEDAVILSTKPCGDGVEVLAMAPDGMRQLAEYSTKHLGTEAYTHPVTELDALTGRQEPDFGASEPKDDAERLQMSTLSFQDYVRTRMLKRRQIALNATSAEQPARHERSPSATKALAKIDAALTHSAQTDPEARTARRSVSSPEADADTLLQATQRMAHSALRAADRAPRESKVTEPRTARDPKARDTRAATTHDAIGSLEQRLTDRPATSATPTPTPRVAAKNALREPPMLHDPVHVNTAASLLSAAQEPVADATMARRNQQDMMNELRSMRGLIEERFGALAFMEKLQRQPAQARLTQRLLDCGFSPVLTRKIAASLTPDTADEMAWAASVLETNLLTGENETPIEDQGGTYALIGATGVGKTTTTAKIAAAFAAKYGASNLGLITLDAYRVGAHEQLRAYGRILGVPVHTAHDRASLDDLLDLLSAKKMILIDTAGMAQRDSRTKELLDMLAHPSIQKLLVINAASQGETIEDVLVAYKVPSCRAVVLSKMDEAVKLGPAVDALIRCKARVIGVANGQRVPEDWHRLSASALVQRALRGGGSAAYRMDDNDVNLVFTAPRAASTSSASVIA